MFYFGKLVFPEQKRVESTTKIFLEQKGTLGTIFSACKNFRRKIFFSPNMSIFKFMVLFMYFLPFYTTLGSYTHIWVVFESEIFFAHITYRARKKGVKKGKFFFDMYFLTPFFDEKKVAQLQKFFFSGKLIYPFTTYFGLIQIHP